MYVGETKRLIFQEEVLEEWDKMTKTRLDLWVKVTQKMLDDFLDIMFLSFYHKYYEAEFDIAY